MISGNPYVTYRSQAGVAEVRHANFADDDDSVEILPQVVLPFRMIGPAGIMQKTPDDWVLVFRLGAASNALLTVMLWNLRTEAHELTRTRGLIHTTLIVASYINEVRVVLSEAKPGSRPWDLSRTRASKLGRQLPWESVGRMSATA